MAELSSEWLKRAKSNLELAKTRGEGICLEDLCFEAQQAAEKALKALMVHLNIKIPKVHSFHIILEQIETKLGIPAEIEDVVTLADYSVQTRYPGDYTPVTEDEYSQAVEIAKKVIGWVTQNLN